MASVSWDRLSGRRIPEASVPECVPDLAVEILNLGNTLAVMSRKRYGYFHAGVRLVWKVDPRERSGAVYTSTTDYRILDVTGKLSGSDVLSGLEIDRTELLAALDRQPNNGCRATANEPELVESELRRFGISITADGQS